ncbi:MAG: RcnB family protein [Syntrophorhabdaceae bacterium]|nr:RcnB family protein [Syntrophorhabdaceae bacterium]
MCKKALLSIIAVFMLIVGQVIIAQAAPHHGPPPPRAAAPHHRPPPPRAAAPHHGPPPPRAVAPHHGPPPPAVHSSGHWYRHAPPTGYSRYRATPSWHNKHGYFRPGYSVPNYYHHNHGRYVVHNWQGRGLYAPPHGHHWLMVDGNFVLAAIATGVIVHVLLGH